MSIFIDCPSNSLNLFFLPNLFFPCCYRNECVLWENEIEMLVFLLALLWNGDIGLLFLIRKATFIHYLCEQRSVVQIIPNSEQKNRFAFAF